MTRRTLTELFRGDPDTDKETVHSYGPVYDHLLEGMDALCLPVLEIGIYKGGSLRVWADYFEGSMIHGLDHNSEYVKECPPPHPRIWKWRIDVNDLDVLAAFAAANGPFGLIVDDGPHELKQQMACHGLLWHFLLPGGVYAIEDIAPGNVELFRYMPGARLFDLRQQKGRDDDVLVAFRK